MIKKRLFLLLLMVLSVTVADTTTVDTHTVKDSLERSEAMLTSKPKRAQGDNSFVEKTKAIIHEKATDSLWSEIDLNKYAMEKFLLVVDRDIPITEKLNDLKGVILTTIVLFILLNIFIFAYYTLESQTAFLEGHPVLKFVISIFKSKEDESQATLKDLRLSVFDFMNQGKIVNTLRSSVQNMWHWLIVGEDYRLKNITVEYAIAATWLLRFGITSLVICVGYFLILPVEGLDAGVRISITLAMSFLLLAVGLFNIDRKFHVIATGFIGGGVAALFLSTFASGTMYHLVNPLMTYLLVAAVTSITSYLAIRVNSMLIALIGIVGAYLAPIALELQASNLVLLNIYLIIVTAGVLWISLFKHWKLLGYVAFFFSWAIATGSLYNFQSDVHFLGTISTFAGLFVLHSGIVYYYNIIKKQRTTIIEIVHLLINCFFFTLFGTYVVRVTLGDVWQGVLTLTIAIFFSTQVYLFLFRKIHDKLLYVTLLGITGFFIAYSVPLLMSSNTLTVTWALLSFFILWLGLKTKSKAIVTIANVFMVLFYGRLLFFDVFLRYLIGVGAEEANGSVGTMTGEVVQLAIVLATIFGISALYRRSVKEFQKITVSEDNDTPYPISFAIASDIAYWLGVGTTFIVGYIWAVGVIPDSTLQQSVLTSLWTLLGIFVLYRHKKTGQNFIVNIAFGILIITLCKFLIIDLTTWRVTFRNEVMTYVSHALSVGVIELFLFLFIRRTKGLPHIYSEFYKFLGILFHLVIFIYLTVEGAVICRLNLPTFESGIISVLWAFFALMYLKIGVSGKSRFWRFLGLSLFGATILKMLLFDMPDQSVLVRLITVMVMGIFLITGAFVYISSMELQKELPPKDDADETASEATADEKAEEEDRDSLVTDNNASPSEA